MTDCSAIKSQLDAKQAILDKIISGQAVQEVWDSDRSRVVYGKPAIDYIRQQIALLQIQYDACQGGCRPVMSRPLTFLF